MWPFSKKGTPPSQGKGREGARPAPVPAPVIRRDWAGLPPIQRVIGDHPLTAPSDRFSDDLATHRDPSVSSDAMGHQVSADAPSGIVLTVAPRVGSRSDGPAMIPRPRVQRRAEDAVAESGEWDGDEAAPESARPNPVPADVQRVAIVERPVVAPIAQQTPLTTLPAEVEPAPVVAPLLRRTAAPYHVDAAPLQRTEVHEMVAAPRLTLGQARRLGLGAPIKRVPDRPSVQRTDDEATTDEITASIEPPVQRLTDLSESTGRIAERIETRSSAADLGVVMRPPLTVARSVAQPPDLQAQDETVPARLDLPLAPGVAREIAPTTAPMGASQVTPPSLPEEGPSTAGAAATPEALPAVQRAMDVSLPAVETAAPQVHDGEPLRPLDAGLSLAHSSMLPLSSDRAARPVSALRQDGRTLFPTSSALTVAPLVSQQPLRPSISLQRAPESPELQPSHVGDDDASPSLSLAQVSRGARPDVFGVLRSAAGVLDARPLAVLQREARPAVALAALSMPARESSTAAFPLAPPTIVQRVAADEAARDAGWTWRASTVQRAEAPAESAPAPVAAPAAASSSPMTVDVAAPEEMSEVEVEALAGRLYTKIRSRLRTELLIDRERAGLLTDLR